MLGPGIGELNVLLKSSTGTSTVWRKIGEQGGQWIQASVEIRKDEQYKVIMMTFITKGASEVFFFFFFFGGGGGGGLKTRAKAACDHASSTLVEIDRDKSNYDIIFINCPRNTTKK